MCTIKRARSKPQYNSADVRANPYSADAKIIFFPILQHPPEKVLVSFSPRSP